MKALLTILKKEITTEFRQKFAFQAVILYLGSTIFVTYLSFNVKAGTLHPITWNTLFWIIMLFAATTGVSKSFIQERRERFLYYYQLVDPLVFLCGKILYNFLLLTVLFGTGIIMYALVLGNPVKDMGLYIFSLFLASAGFSSCLTIVSAIASFGKNSGTLMAVLGFPVILPLLLMLIKIAKAGMDGIKWELVTEEIVIFASVNAIVLAVSFILFPYLWRT